jgi:hypothetical protein
MKTFKHVFLALLLAAFGLGVAACSKKDDKGPMERAGRAVDQAMDKAKEQTGQAMKKAGEAMKEAGEKMREGGEKEKN